MGLFKLRIALFLAAVAGFLTIASGLLNDTRSVTALYRAGISATVFGCCGFLLGGIAETLFLTPLKNVKLKGQNIDIIDKGEADDEFVVSQQLQSDEEFRPLTPDMVKRVYRT